MLVLHSSSRCDVCLSEYTWETSGKRPHAIACGHIFCRDCLYTNSPPLCPLCRKSYQPNKMKKLHVDRPEDIDDHKELDLLQRLAVSWEIPLEQLRELTTEVDLWLRDRSDDACIALRRARAALTRHRELKDSEASLEESVRELEQRLDERNRFLLHEQNRALVLSEASSSKLDSLTKENHALKLEIESLQSLTHRYTQPRNPLPRPPEPISIDHLPTFEQAVSESGSVRFASLPVSPLSQPSPYLFSERFEIERPRRKGKSKSKEQKYYDDPIYQPAPSAHTNQVPPPASSHYVRPHLSTPTSQHDHSPKQSTRAQGLQTHFESTAQPLDGFALTQAYLREYSSGFVNGQEAALGKRVSDFPSSQSPYPGQASSSRHAAQPRSAFEPSQDYRTTNVHLYQSQPYSAPVISERSPRPAHRRQPTLTSIISSGSSAQNDRSSSRSRSRSRPSSTVSRYSNPLLASILSDRPARSPPRHQSFGPVSPQISQAVPPNSFNPTVISQQQQQPTLSRTSTMASNSRYSPSSRSHMTLLSSDTWGTAAQSHLTTGSLIPGLAAFRFDGEPDIVGGQESISFHDLGSDGASIRTREMSFSEMSSEPINSPPSPVRPVHSMVGVLPAEGDLPSYRSRRDERTSSYHSNQNGWNTNAGHATTHHRSSSSLASGYNDDRSQRVVSPNHWHGQPQDQDGRSGTYRSPTSVDNRGYDSWAGRDGYARTQGHAATTRVSSNDDRSRRQQQPAEDHASVTSSDRQGRSRRPPAHTRASHLSLPAESPFPVSVEYTEENRHSHPSSVYSSPGTVLATEPLHFDNALGLQLSTGPTPINAPTPVNPNQSFLRSWSREH